MSPRRAVATEAACNTRQHPSLTQRGRQEATLPQNGLPVTGHSMSPRRAAATESPCNTQNPSLTRRWRQEAALPQNGLQYDCCYVARVRRLRKHPLQVLTGQGWREGRCVR